MKKIFFIGLFATLLFAGCSTFENEQNDENAQQNQQNSSAVLSFSINSAATSSRSAFPTVSVDSFNYITISYKEEDSSTDNIIGSWNSYSDLKNSTVPFKVGTYVFTVLASCDSGIYSEGRTIEIKKGTNKLSFSLIPMINSNAEYRTGYGSLSVSLSFPPENVKIVTAGLYSMEEAKISGFADEVLSFDESGNCTYSKSEVPAGDYILIFKFYADEAKTLLIGTYREYASIYALSESSSKPTLSSLANLFSIKYELNGGTFLEGFTAQGSYSRLSQTVFLPTSDKISKTNAIFDGWYLSEDYSDSPVTSISDGSTGNKTFYAKWIPTVLVTFLPNGGTFGDDATAKIKTQEFVTGEESNLLRAADELYLTNGKRSFQGWVKAPSSTTADFADGQSVTLTENLVLYALWSISTINPTEDDGTDTDGDGLSDWLELNVYHTDPSNKDTDGDGWTDGEEVRMYNEGANTFNPLIANIPMLDVKFTQRPSFGFKYTTTSGSTDSSSVTQAEGTVHSASNTNTNAKTHSLTNAWSTKASVGVEYGANQNGLFSAVAKAHFGFEVGYNGSVTNGDSFTYSKSQSESYSSNISEGRTTSVSQGKTITGGAMDFDIKLVNPSDIAYTIKSVTVTASAISDFRNPQNAGRPVVSVTYDKPMTLQPHSESNQINLKSDLSIPTTENLLKWSSGINLEVAGYTISMDRAGHTVDFTEIYTTAKTQTAKFNIDYGPSSGKNSESYLIATKNKYNTGATSLENQYKATTIKDLLETVGISTEKSNLVLSSDGRIIGIKNVNHVSQREGTWFVMHSYTRNNTSETSLYNSYATVEDGSVVDISQIQVQAGDTVSIFYSVDKDGDGVPLNEELLYGTSDENPDTDGDGLTDFEEIYGWKPSEKAAASGNTEKITTAHPLMTEYVYTNPLIADTDGDGIPDGEDPNPTSPLMKNDTSLATCQYKTSSDASFKDFTLSSTLDDSSVNDYIYLNLVPKTSYTTVKYKLSASASYETILAATEAIKLTAGENKIYIQITAADGVTTEEKTLTVNSYFKAMQNLILTSKDYVGGKITFSFVPYTDSRVVGSSDGGMLLHFVKGTKNLSDDNVAGKTSVYSESDFKADIANAKSRTGIKPSDDDFWTAVKAEELKAGSFTVSGLESQRQYCVDLVAYSNNGTKNARTAFASETATAKALPYCTTAKSEKGKLTVWAHRVENVVSRDGSTNPSYFWTCSSTEAQIPFGECTVTNKEHQKFRKGCNDYYCFGKKEMHRSALPTAYSTCSKEMKGEFSLKDNYSFELAFDGWEWDAGANPSDHLGKAKVQFYYDKSTGSWTVTCVNIGQPKKTYTLAWSEEKSDYYFDIDASAGYVRVFFGLRWWEE